MKEEILRMENINKSFQNTKILKNFRLNVFKGEILGLVGLSDTGKTLISNILTGHEKIDSGKIYFDESKVNISSCSKARKMGIFNIQEKGQLVSQLSIADNIFVIRNNSMKKILINKKAVYNQTKRLLNKIGLTEVYPSTKVEKLTSAQYHLVELTKALVEDAKLVIVDDLLDLYNENEIKKLKEVMFQFKKDGISFLLTTNKTEILTEFTDRISILRDGKNIKTLYKGDYDHKLILHLIIGKEFLDKFEREKVKIGEKIFEVKGLSSDFLRDINFELYEREILGVLDLDTASNVALFDVLTGKNSNYSGEIYLKKEKLKLLNSSDIIKKGIGIIPQDSINRGLISNMNPLDNLLLPSMKRISNNFLYINKRVKSYIYDKFLNDLNIDLSNEKNNLDFLDIYTQQKILYSKWLLYNPELIICFNPTIKSDVLSRKLIFEFLERYVKNNISVLVISTDIQEVSSICDRILLVKNNTIQDQYTREEFKNIKIDNFY